MRGEQAGGSVGERSVGEEKESRAGLGWGLMKKCCARDKTDVAVPTSLISEIQLHLLTTGTEGDSGIKSRFLRINYSMRPHT